MEIISAEPNIRIRFRASLPQDIFSTCLLLDATNRIDGVSDWVVQTAARLPAELSQLLRHFGLLMAYSDGLWGELVGELLAQEGASYQALVSHLTSMPAEDYGRVLRLGIDRRLARWESAPAGGALQAEPAELLRLLKLIWQHRQKLHGGATFDRMEEGQVVVSYCTCPGQFKEHLLSILSGVWQAGYEQQSEVDRIQVEKAIVFHRGQRNPQEFRAAFVAITGRTIPPSMIAWLNGTREVVMVPSCHIGPYFVFVHQGDKLFVSFNAKTASDLSTGREKLSDLYPPLKALADETRLEIISLLLGGERYVGEIAELLNLSQSSASRHLSLLMAAELLVVRRENNQKYYSLDQGRARALIASLEALFNL